MSEHIKLSKKNYQRLTSKIDRLESMDVVNRKQERDLNANIESLTADFRHSQNKVNELMAGNERVSSENKALRAAFGSLRDKLTELSLQAEDAVIAINMNNHDHP